MTPALFEITASQVRMARAALRWSVEEPANRACCRCASACKEGSRRLPFVLATFCGISNSALQHVIWRHLLLPFLGISSL